jgi:hypothetical protein
MGELAGLVDDLRSHIGGVLRPPGQADVTRMEV